jgi:hypothetical protein
MSRYVILHKLSRGFRDWEYKGSYVESSRETVPTMNAEFSDWYRENQHLIKAVHSQKMVELDRTQIAFEFHNAEDALMCMLQFG